MYVYEFKYIIICDADKMPKCSEMDNFDKKNGMVYGEKLYFVD